MIPEFLKEACDALLDDAQALSSFLQSYMDAMDEATSVQALNYYGYDYYGSMPASETISPCLLDRIWPDMWAPGINHQHEQARGLVMALPMWERSGNHLHDLHSGNTIRLGG